MCARFAVCNSATNLFQLLRQEVNQGVTYSYTIPTAQSSTPTAPGSERTSSSPGGSETHGSGTGSKNGRTSGSERHHSHIPLPALPPEDNLPEPATVFPPYRPHSSPEGAGGAGSPAPSDQATAGTESLQEYLNPERGTPSPTPGQSSNRHHHREKSQYSQQNKKHSDSVHRRKSSHNHRGNAYTDSRASVSTSPNAGYDNIMNSYNRHRTSSATHRVRHNHRKRHNRVRVQSSPVRRYDQQTLRRGTSTPVTYLPPPPDPNKPHIISALTPEGQRRYKYASQQTQTAVYPSRPGVHPNPYPHQGNNNPALGVHQYGGGYYGAYPAPISLNDQISLSLPEGPTHHQIGNVDSGSDYSWRISGFSECTQSCGGGE